MRTPAHQPPAAGSGLEPIGDPDDETPDFAGEHQRFVTEDADGAEAESADRYTGGLDRAGP